MLFITKAAQKLLGKTKPFLVWYLKMQIVQQKLRFLSIFVQFCGVTSVSK